MCECCVDGGVGLTAEVFMDFRYSQFILCYHRDSSVLGRFSQRHLVRPGTTASHETPSIPRRPLLHPTIAIATSSTYPFAFAPSLRLAP